MGCTSVQPTFIVNASYIITKYGEIMATHSAELEHALKTLKQLTGISLDVAVDAPKDEAAALAQVRRLCSAYRDKYNHGRFLQDLLVKELPLPTVLEEARRLRLSVEEPRVLFVIESKHALQEPVVEILRLLFPTQASKALIPINETRMAIAYPLSNAKRSLARSASDMECLDKHALSNAKRSPARNASDTECPDGYALKISDTEKEIRQTAHTIIDTLNAEALISVRLAYSTIFHSLTELHSVYEETSLALHIGRLFYPEQNLFFSNRLGVGRLIYGLPPSACEKYLEEIWDSKVPAAMDEEIMATVNTFLQNNLNIAETARQLHMHRNTLIYRINQVQKQTGLDLRNFEDAMQFKIATMILNRMNHRDPQE